jgi:hypothetical protein
MLRGLNLGKFGHAIAILTIPGTKYTFLRALSYLLQEERRLAQSAKLAGRLLCSARRCHSPQPPQCPHGDRTPAKKRKKNQKQSPQNDGRGRNPGGLV